MENNEQGQKLHGNQARIDPAKKIESLYQSNLVTASNEKIDETPVSSNENVEFVREFSEENQK